MMPRVVASLALVLLLAGCASPGDGQTPTTSPSTTSTTSAPAPSAPHLAVNPIVASTDATLTLTGAVSPAATVRVSALRNDGTTQLYSVEADGAWSLEIPLTDFGHTNLTIEAGDVGALATEKVVAIRLATATMKARFNNYPERTDYTTPITWDPDGRASAPMYDGRSLAHPDFATVHDAMVEWSAQDGPVIVYAYSDGSVKGYSVVQMDGVGTPVEGGTLTSTWCYRHYDAAGTEYSGVLGLSIQPMTPGDTVDWGLGCFI